VQTQAHNGKAWHPGSGSWLRSGSAASGLLLVVFLLLHLAGVALAPLAPQRFEAYAAALHRSAWLPAAELALLACIGTSASAGQWMALKAFRAAEASAVVPYDYLRLVFAILWGWLFFAETPDRWTLAGSAILIGATLYIAYREIGLGKAPAVGG